MCVVACHDRARESTGRDPLPRDAIGFEVDYLDFDFAV